MASGTKKTRHCLSANLRGIRFFGRQMIITYGQSCKCDFTPRTIEAALTARLPQRCLSIFYTAHPNDEVICRAFLLEHHVLDTGKF